MIAEKLERPDRDLSSLPRRCQNITDMRRQMPEKRWPVSPAEARQLQERLRGRVVTKDQLGVVHEAAGADGDYCAGQVWAAVVVMSLPNLAAVGSALVHRRLTFPYVPGLLSIREAQAIGGAPHQLSVS